MRAWSSRIWTRRELMVRLSTVAAGAGLIALGARTAMAEPPPETRTIRLPSPEKPILCFAPQYLVEAFLRLEGFTDVRFRGFEGATSGTQGLANGTFDLAAGLGTGLITAFDGGAPIVILSGLHAGCTELFANDAVPRLRDLAGKRVPISRPGDPVHVMLSSIVAYIGIDPKRDIEWVVEPNYGAYPELLEAGKVDAVHAFPPQNFVLRERGLGHVILNTTVDDPWRHFFCCMVGARREFVESHPVATKRAVRALVKANQLCEADREGSARRLVELGATARYDYALAMLEEVPYGAWRSYEPRDTVRFYALRLHEAGLVKGTPREILERGTDFRFIDEIRHELRV